MYKNSDIKCIKNLRDNFYLVTGKMTGGCNFHCPYCINAINRNTFSGGKSETEIIEVARKINNLLIKNNITKPLKLKLVGGEVCFYDLPKVLDNISNISKLLITTNFSRDLDYFKDLYIYCKNRNINLFLIVSYHEENTDFQNKAIELTNGCRLNNLSVPQISYVVNENFDFSILDYYKENNIFRIKLIAEKDDNDQIVNLSDKVKEKLAYYNSMYNRLNSSVMYEVTFMDNSKKHFSNIYHFINNLDENGFIPDGYICTAGTNMFTVGYDNNVYLNKCKYLTNICLGSLDDDIKLSSDPIECHASDVGINKQCRCNLCSSVSVGKKEC